jgi:hypothetical protein
LAALELDLSPVVNGQDEDTTESPARRPLLSPRTKGGPRAVRLSEHAIGLLTRALAREPQHAHIFANPRTGKPYTADHVSLRWRQHEPAGWSIFTFTICGIMAPTVAVNRGATVPVLMALGGWKCAAMVQRHASVMNPTLDHLLQPTVQQSG